MVFAVVLSALLSLSYVASSILSLAVQATGDGIDAGLSDFIGLVSSGGFVVTGMFLLAGLLMVVSLVLVAVAAVRLHRGDWDLCARIVFAEYVVLALAALLLVAFSMTGGVEAVASVGNGLSMVWSWLLLGVCGVVALALCYRLFFKDGER